MHLTLPSSFLPIRRPQYAPPKGERGESEGVTSSKKTDLIPSLKMQ